jgi:hypothetical protein
VCVCESSYRCCSRCALAACPSLIACQVLLGRWADSLRCPKHRSLELPPYEPREHDGERELRLVRSYDVCLPVYLYACLLSAFELNVGFFSEFTHEIKLAIFQITIYRICTFTPAGTQPPTEACSVSSWDG